MANSWKKYGGIYKSDKYNSIGVGTMVADQVLIRQRVITSSQVEGSLTVGEYMSVGIDLTVANNLSVSGDLYVDNTEYIGDKLYFNKIKDEANNYTAFIAGNSKLGRLGIGTITPTSFFDIEASNSSTNSGIGGSTAGSDITNVLTVRNSNNKIRNIIAQNMHKSGIVVETIGNIASMGFYKGNVDISAAIPPVYITADPSNSILTLNSKDNNITSSNNTNITSTYNTNITANIIDLSANDIVIKSSNDLSMNVAANARLNTTNTLTITSGNVTKINSFVSISKRATNEPLLNGTITIYDNSVNTYLVDYYQQSSVKSGNAITVVSSDNSSNSFINIITPNKQGFSIGGGTHPGDISRSMGTIGLTSTDASYQPAQVIVANNTEDKHKISVGINTYSPETSKYVMDINGPTRIGSGEMHIKVHTNFQQNSVYFSKQNPSFGVISGSPYIKEPGQSGLFQYKFLVTSDGGVNWTSYSDISGVSITTRIYDSLDVYSINQNEFLYIGSQNSPRFGYARIDNITPSNNRYYIVDYDNLIVRAAHAFIDTSNNYKILIGGDLSNNGSKSVISYYNVAPINNVVAPINASTVAPGNIASIDASCSNIKHSDGNTSVAYFVGNGIEKVDFSSAPPKSVSYKNSEKRYTKVYAYDANYVVAIGYIPPSVNTIISYTRNGGETWTDILNAGSNFNTIYPYPNYNSGQTVQSFTIKHLVLVDNMNGIATGSFIDNTGKKRPLMICTKDGSATWSRIDPKVFYSSGVGNYIENTTLSCVAPSSSNNFVVVNNITDSSYNNPTLVSGNSDIIYGYLPNLFNVYSNQVVDVNGGMNVDGKIWQF
jgi:hypothetical protein